ncbi:hypothetical protein QJS04_geneDACA001582 [Acorus gramineus]|uniref:RRM domain-containing protein n=1 Tax=Acorus gramineus TaxID=55184 RepID=A0AAV9BL13_ACOGR|nr:hypothetical protein QJS04_geneDACA001582 [Acorus gramineus]
MDDMSAAAAGYYYPPQPPPAVLHNPHYPYYHQQPPPPPPAVEFHPPPPPGQLYHHHHHLTSYGIPPPYHPHNSDEVRTLFIAGLPEDVKSREIYSLFHEFPGYESCHLRSSGQSNQGIVFDLEKESTLYIDLAKSNSRSKRPRSDDSTYNSFDKKARGSAAFSKSHTDASDGSNFHLPGIGNSAYNMNAHPSAQSYGNFDSDAGNDAEPKTKMNNTPCPTLFVANLGPSCTEQELRQAFIRCPGFLKLKMQNKHGVPVAFVDFQDTACSTAALNHLQGMILYSSAGGEGMRLEYPLQS